MNQNKLLNLLNQGSREELMALPGIGPVLADGLIAARPFETLEDAEVVNGISANIIKNLEEAVAEGDFELSPESQENKEEKDELSAAEIDQDLDEESELIRQDLPESSEVKSELEETDPESVSKAKAEDEALGESMPVESLDTLREGEQVSSDEPVEEYEAVSDQTQAYSEPAPATLAANQPTEQVVDISTEEETHFDEGVPKTEESVGKEDQVERKEVAEEMGEVTKSGVSVLVLIATSAFTALVTILLTLVVLAGINGSLKFATESDFRAMQRDAAQLSTQLETLQHDLTGLGDRVEALEGLNERMGLLEGAQEQLTSDLEVSNQRISEVQAELTDLEEEVKQQEERTQRFENFLVNLQALLSDLFEPQGEQP